ncbi:hypothetical protein [Algibacillus agarilyticus]|uniref:hypothetical protein n=1 Tax=Algibacillus agarilyticus TaxID=2234133 RepID=UPI000DD05E78|nr:hypothetical protein [Algibacillus agarilyticus]
MRILILSLSRSGSTALYYQILAEMPKSTLEIFEPSIDLLKLKDLPSQCIAKVIIDSSRMESLSPLIEKFDHVIVLVRDPRDRLVSSMLFAMHGVDKEELDRRLHHLKQKSESPIETPFLDLIANIYPGWTVEKVCKQVSTDLKLVDEVLCFSKRCICIKYEMFIQNSIEDLRDQLGLNSHGQYSIPEKHAYGKRRVKSGDWKNWFLSSDVTHLKPFMQPFILNYQYEATWEHSESPCIPLKHSIDFVLNAYHKNIEMTSKGIKWQSS